MGRCIVRCEDIATPAECVGADGAVYQPDASQDAATSDRQAPPEAATADVTLDARTDVLVCGDAGMACSAACVDTATSPENCGACGRICPEVVGGIPACAASMCAVRCLMGYHACGSACSLDSSPLSCGTACTPCPAPAGATATCSAAGVCGWECSPGFERVGAGCEIRVPRQLTPGSTTSVSVQRPTFRWQLSAGSDGATVEICRQRACDSADIVQTVDGTGSSVVASTALSAGVWYWRLRGRLGGVVGMRTGPVWQFTVGARSAAIETVGGVAPDVNGDGYADALVGATGPGRVYAFLGSPTGIARAYATALSSPSGQLEPGALAAAGDVDGDGFGDAIFGDASANTNDGAAYLFAGSAGGLRTAAAATLLPSRSGDRQGIGFAVAAAGDVNGDGYADVVVGGRTTSAVWVYLGSATGLSTARAVRLAPPTADQIGFGTSVTGLGDIDADGYADFAVGAPDSAGFPGSVYIYRGASAGPGTLPPIVLRPAASVTNFGRLVASGGDVNGDGLADLLVGTSRAATSALYAGSMAGIAPSPIGTLSTGSVTETNLRLDAIAGAGDIEGDGFADVIAGASAAGSTGQGRLYVFRGGASGLGSGSVIESIAGASGTFGKLVAGLGDSDGDHLADVIVGAPTASAELGRAYVFLGAAAGLRTSGFVTLSGPDSGRAYFGAALAGRSGP